MKKLLATLLASTMALSALGSLVACGDGDGGNKTLTGEVKPADFHYVTNLDDPLQNKSDADETPVEACDITVWAPAEIKPTYESLVTAFKSSNYHNGKYANVNVTIEAKPESDVKAALGTDASSGADVFFFVSDHIGDMMRSNWLLPLRGSTGSYYSAAIMQRDLEGAAQAVAKDGYCYAFPTTADNGYYLVYNKDDFTGADADKLNDLDAILALAEAKGKSFFWNYTDSFYTSTFFFGAGVEMSEKGPESEYSAFKSAKAEIGAKATVKYINDERILPSIGGNNGVKKAILDGTLIAGFCGTWENPDESELETIGCAKLPMFTAPGSTTKYQMGSLYGGKYCGVNAYSKNGQVAMALANFLTNTNAQRIRFENHTSGPSNKSVAELPSVAENIPLKAYNDQVVAGGVYNGDIASTWWSGMKTYGEDIEKGKVTLNDLGLEDLVTALNPQK